MPLEASQTAPDFRLQNQNEDWITLSGLLERGPVMVVFYPGDFTPVCTKQLCAYQDALGSFAKHGIQIVGISAQDAESHLRFRSQYGFSFDLLSDPGKGVTKSFGATSLFMLGSTSRAVFIIGRDRRVLYRYVEPTALSHRRPGQLLEALDQLSSSGQLTM